MNIFKRYNFKKILLGVFWISVSGAGLLLLVAAVRKKDKNLCKGIEINIRGASNNFFIDRADVMEIITSYTGSNPTGESIDAFNLVAMETLLKKDVWILNAELFFDNNNVLQVEVEEREPTARIFNVEESSFYIDNTCKVLPLSEKLSARLPVFTGFPSGTDAMSKEDKNLLKDINTISNLLQKDSFLMAMIDQVDITPKRNFEMIPKLGDQVIAFGDAGDAENKLIKLKLFYKKVMVKYGWSRYSIINLQYRNQVIGKIKGADDVSADSVRALEIMHAIAENAAKMASDSIQTIIQDNERNTTSTSFIEHSLQRDDDDGQGDTDAEMPVPMYFPLKPIDKPVEKPVLTVVAKPGQTTVKKHGLEKPKPVVKPIKKVAVTNKPDVPKPKIIMPPKNDY